MHSGGFLFVVPEGKTVIELFVVWVRFPLAGKIKSHKNVWMDQNRCHRAARVLVSQQSSLAWQKVCFTRELWGKCCFLPIIAMCATQGGIIRIFRYFMVQKHVLTEPTDFPDQLVCLKLYEHSFGHNTFSCGFLFFVPEGKTGIQLFLVWGLFRSGRKNKTPQEYVNGPKPVSQNFSCPSKSGKLISLTKS